MSDKAILALVCSLILLIAFANLVRLFWEISLTVGTFVIPGWTGGILFIIFGILGIWALRALRNLSRQLSSDPANL